MSIVLEMLSYTQGSNDNGLCIPDCTEVSDVQSLGFSLGVTALKLPDGGCNQLLIQIELGGLSGLGTFSSRKLVFYWRCKSLPYKVILGSFLTLRQGSASSIHAMPPLAGSR